MGLKMYLNVSYQQKNVLKMKQEMIELMSYSTICFFETYMYKLDFYSVLYFYYNCFN